MHEATHQNEEMKENIFPREPYLSTLGLATRKKHLLNKPDSKYSQEQWYVNTSVFNSSK